MKKVAFLVVLVAVLGARVNSQQPEPRKNPDPAQTRPRIETGSISVTLVQVDAVVRDAKGRQVTDLKLEDFEILEDARPQRITNFSYISTESSRPEAKAAIRPDKLAPPLRRRCGLNRSNARLR